jgi:hypothetical protein
MDDRERRLAEQMADRLRDLIKEFEASARVGQRKAGSRSSFIGGP